MPVLRQRYPGWFILHERQHPSRARLPRRPHEGECPGHVRGHFLFDAASTANASLGSRGISGFFQGH